MMNRKNFLKNGLSALSAALVIPSFSFKKDDSNTLLACQNAPTETAGPFPTHTPSSLVMPDIRSDRTGIDMTINITIQNTNNSCASLQGAIVDIWHCDREGNYSEYGGPGTMQSTNYTTVHFLRGRQTSNAAGVVSFLTKFPGWYNGRATHIHVHVYNASGTSLMITQIAFPEGANSAVALVNATAGYKPLTAQYTYNATDNVFGNQNESGWTAATALAAEMSVITGSVANGYTLTHTIIVEGGVVTCAANGGTLSF
jgi:protocatechuate 3,4-dioxygenase beta subunit